MPSQRAFYQAQYGVLKKKAYRKEVAVAGGKIAEIYSSIQKLFGHLMRDASARVSEQLLD